MIINSLQKAIFLLFGCLLLSLQSGGAKDELVSINQIYPEEVKSSGFLLNEKQEIQIEAVGANIRDEHFMMSNAWILNADSRDVVWEMTEANSRRKSRELREYRDKITLEKGRFEIYYAVFPSFHYHDLWSFVRFFLDGSDYDDFDEKIFKDFQIVVRGNGKELHDGEVENIREKLRDDAILSLIADHDEQYLTEGFRLKTPMDLKIYAIGEAREDGAFDYGWIINTQTRNRVWKLDYRNSDYGGGSEKNRMIKETISLPAGSYAALFVSDDSHSPREWNAFPPYDPSFWGLTILSSNESQKNNVELFDYEEVEPENVFIEFTHLRDDEMVSKGFTLKKDMEVRIYALGEGRGGEMFDYGWIVDAQSHHRVWVMDYHNTEHAGGSSKNRLVDDVVFLEKGDYILYYVTDGSHSFRRWNAAPPLNRDRWGITVMGADRDFNPKDVIEYSPEEDQSILVKLVGIGDWESTNADLTLQRDGEIHIYALGEGRSGRMFDYAWIEEANTGKVVWEMTYRKTKHAGGARKNREFNDTIYLPAGDYTVYYESDDSHSYKDWNAAPPYDPVNYGITIDKVKD